jgi:hypothetical protein
MLDQFRTFALEGFALPAFMIAVGSAMVLFPKRSRPEFSRAQLEGWNPVFRWLATRNWSEAKSGWFTIACGVVIALTRLVR